MTILGTTNVQSPAGGFRACGAGNEFATLVMGTMNVLKPVIID